VCVPRRKKCRKPLVSSFLDILIMLFKEEIDAKRFFSMMMIEGST